MSIQEIAPILVVCYRRPQHLKKTLDALRNNRLADQSDLFIYSDGPNTNADMSLVRQVRTIAHRVKGFKTVTVIERPMHYGLEKNIISAISDMFARFETLIVFEDDLVSSPFFLQYINDGLSMYKNDEQVAVVHGYVYPTTNVFPETYFLKSTGCWGWGTWRRAWRIFEPNGQKLLDRLEHNNLISEFDMGGAYPYTQMLRRQIAGTINSWAIRWRASIFLHGMYTLYPGRSLIQNIGVDGSGTHSRQSAAYRNSLSPSAIKVERIPIEEVEENRMTYEKSLTAARKRHIRSVIINTVAEYIKKISTFVYPSKTYKH